MTYLPPFILRGVMWVLATIELAAADAHLYVEEAYFQAGKRRERREGNR